MVIMKKIKFIQCAAIGCLCLMSQACSIPASTAKKPDTKLPDRYSAGASGDKSTASVNWKEFFEDAHLIALIEVAVVNNKEVNVMLQRVAAAQNEIQARKGEYLPSVGFGAAADVEKAGRFTRNGAVEEQLEIKEGKAFPEYLGNYQFGLFSSWEIDVWKKLRNSAQVAAFEYMASTEGKNFLVTNLVAEIARSYYELVALDFQLENLDKNIQLQKNGLEAVRQLQKYGRANTLAAKRYEGEISKNQSKIYVIKQQLVETENRINLLMGRTPQPIRRSSAGFLNIKPKLIQTGIPSQLLRNRPDIRQAELELSAASLNIDVARANFYPSFSIKAGAGFQAFKTKYLLNSPESLALSLAGDVVAPIVNRNAIIAQYKNANARQIQAAYDYEQAIINAYTEVINQVSNLDNLDKNYQQKNNQVDALKQSIELASQLFQSSRVEYLEVLLTQRDALDAEMELIETKQKQIVAMVDLYRALGGGWH